MPTSNRKYKDSVFVDLFSDDEKAKENFEKEFEGQYDKKQMVYKCVDIANGSI